MLAKRMCFPSDTPKPSLLRSSVTTNASASRNPDGDPQVFILVARDAQVVRQLMLDPGLDL